MRLSNPVFLLLIGARLLIAQKLPARPGLPEGADTNDAVAYYEFGNAQLSRDPSTAADAFYWATRLDPSHAESYYGRRVALLISNPRRLAQYDRGVRSVVQSSDMLQLDTLLARALMLNPVLSLRHERLVTFTLIKEYVEQDYGPTTLQDEAAIQSYIDRSIRSGMGGQGNWLAARIAQGDGDYTRALNLYATTIKQLPKKAEARTMRGRLFLQVGKPDSALSELSMALDELRKRDKKDFVVFYNSKAALEIATGVAAQQLGNTAAAKDAFGRALAEDLAYYPAHVRLGYLALDQRDTLTALSELDLATQIRPDDGLLRDQYGYALFVVGKTDAATEQFRKSVELEPYFTLPLRHLGEAYEKAGKKAEAQKAYQSFLRMARRNDPMLDDVKSRLAKLSS